jgi:hypothetical protein
MLNRAIYHGIAQERESEEEDETDPIHTSKALTASSFVF